MPNDFRVSITDAPGEKAYPISSFTWLLVPAEFSDKSKLKAMKDFLQWMSTDGQKLTEQLPYATLPSQIVGPMDLWHINARLCFIPSQRKRRSFPFGISTWRLTRNSNQIGICHSRVWLMTIRSFFEFFRQGFDSPCLLSCYFLKFLEIAT